MACEKVFLPAKDAVLHGLLSDFNVTLCAFTDIFPVKKYVTLRSGLLLATQALICKAQKEMEVCGGITLDASEAAAFALKEGLPLDGKLVLAALLSTAIRKTVDLQADLAVSGDVTLTVGHWLSGLQSELSLGGTIKSVQIDYGADFWNSLVLKGAITSVSKLTDITPARLVVDIASELNPAMLKQAAPAAAGLQFDGVLNAVICRYRTIGDLEGLTLADVRDWSLKTFYYLEV